MEYRYSDQGTSRSRALVLGRPLEVSHTDVARSAYPAILGPIGASDRRMRRTNLVNVATSLESNDVGVPDLIGPIRLSPQIRRKFSLGLAAALGLVSVSSVASADVMEIGQQGFTWVAGGPAEQVAQPAGPETTPEPVAISGTELHPASFTQVGASAGPAQWQSRVAELAAKYDLSPTLLEAVIWQESRWNAGAVSPVGARGLAQLMPGTARQMGIDLRDPSANLEGGARYMRFQLDAFGGDLEKALAAYNAGPARVQRAGGIPAIRETQLYVSSILARLSAPVRK